MDFILCYSARKIFLSCYFAMIKRYFEHCTYPKMPSLVVLRHTKVPHGMLDSTFTKPVHFPTQ